MSWPKKLIIGLCALIVPLSLASFAMPPAYAENPQLFAACDPKVSNSQAANSTLCNDKNTTTNPVNHILHVATDLVALLAGLAAVILIIVSGISMITSAGNAEAVGNARKRITNAVIGLVIIALAWTIVSFATDKLIT